MNAASRKSLLAVGLCAVGVAAALGWATLHALRLERREREAEALARVNESIRLALWRMDSALTPILARETARPYFHYSAFYPSERAYTSMLEDIAPGEHLVPSPLLTLDQQFVRLYFQRSSRGEITSPQVPTGNFRDLVESGYGGSERLLAAEARLFEVGTLLTSGRAPLAAADEMAAVHKQLAGAAGEPAAVFGRDVSTREPLPALDQTRRAGTQQQLAQSAEDLQREYQTRQQIAGRSVQLEKQSNLADRAILPEPPRAETATASRGRKDEDVRESAQKSGTVSRGTPAPAAPAFAPAENEDNTEAARDPLSSETLETRARETASKEAFLGVEEAADKKRLLADDANRGVLTEGTTESVVEVGDMAPVWRVGAQTGEPQLLLLRTARVGESRLEQGCWLDWPALRVWLLSSVHDLLPGATLRPVAEPYAQADPEALGRRLAGISAELDAGPMSPVAAAGWTPMRTTLVLTWGAVVLSFGAIGAALLAARELAERRGQFVSAVTHELRTPLTTFCLYSQMLADGMVPDEPSKREYLGTLRSESERLTRIVESVLEYARVGRSNGAAKRETVSVPALIERVVPLLRARAERAGTAIEGPGEIDDGLRSASVEVDPVSVERVLGNLVDNACKYAPGSPVRLTVRAAGRGVEFEIADGGPGVPREQRSRLFQPFERGRSLAHATTPGLGLGLALSRELARRMGGELELRESSARGSAFVLRVTRGGKP